MRGDDCRGATTKHGEQARRHEEVGVDDVGTEPAGSRRDVTRQGEVARAPAAPVDDRALELVAARGEGRFEVGDERAERGRVRPRVHLGDEKDAHPATLPPHRTASYVPHSSRSAPHSSPTVARAASAVAKRREQVCRRRREPADLRDRFLDRG